MRRAPRFFPSTRSGVATKSLPQYAGLARAGRVAVPLHGDFFMHPNRNPTQPTQILSPNEKCITDNWWHMHSAGYAERTSFIDGKKTTILAHREVMQEMIGRKLLRGEVVDHINGDKLDNRRENLRIVTHSQNLQNWHVNRPYRGTGWDATNGKWMAYVSKNKKRHNLGRFSSREDAYKVAEQKRNELGFLTATP